MTGNFSVELACLARRWWHSRLLIATPGAGAIAEVVHVTDPVAYAGSLIVIVGACLLAASIPALRASRLEPMRTLRQD